MGEETDIDHTPFLLRLPPELLDKIFLRLSLPDRFMCRATCRTLMAHFQCFPSSMWRHLRLKERMIYRFKSLMGADKSRRRVIRKYARHISAHFPVAFGTKPVMDALTTGQWHCIESISLVNANSCASQFMELIRNQHRSLKSIRLLNSDILASGCFTEIFSICLELERFHYIDRRLVGRGERGANPEASDFIISRPIRLASLHLNFDYDAEIVFISLILQHSPELVDLELISDYEHDDSQMLQLIQRHCSKLTNFKYLQRYGTFCRGKKNQVRFSGRGVSFHVNPRSDMTEEGSLLVPWIHKFHETIEDLEASMCLLTPYTESLPQLTSVQYPQLRVLDLHCVHDYHGQQYPSTQLSDFIQSCPALEKLCLLHVASITDPVLRTIGELSQLCHLELEPGTGSVVTPEGIRWLLATTTSLKTLIFTGNEFYFTNEHLHAVAQYKGLVQFSLESCASELSASGVYKFINLIRDASIEYLLLGRLHDLDRQTISAFAQLHTLKYLEIGVFTRGYQSRFVDDLFDARTSDHTLIVKYLNGNTPETMSSAIDYYSQMYI